MSPKPKVAPAPIRATVVKAKPTGLQLSAAQWRAYNSAYSATSASGFAQLRAASQTAALARRRALFAAAVQSLRRSRLAAAYKLQKITAASHARAQTAAIATYAARQSLRQAQLAHQNQALVQRVYANYERHLRQAARLQYIYKGEKVYTHTAVMRTLTTAQATTAMAAQQAKAARTARSALNSTSSAASAASAAAFRVAAANIRAKAQAAGMAAANAVPALQQSAAVRSRASAKARATAHATASAHARATAARNKKGVKAPRAAPRPASLGPLCNPRRSAWYFGDPEGYDCVAAAIANHLSARRAYVLDDKQYARLVTILGGEPTIKHALWRVKEDGILGGAPLLADYKPVSPFARDHCVIGFETEKGAHAAYCSGSAYGLSWGELIRVSDFMLPGTEVDEAWSLVWK